MIAAFRSVNCYIVKVSFVCLSVASAYCLSVLLMVAFLKDNLVSDLGNPGCLDFHFSWNKNAKKDRSIRSPSLRHSNEVICLFV